MYHENYKVELIEASEVAFLDSQFALEYSCELTYGWLSAEGKTEAYNQANRDTYNESQAKMFLRMNPNVGNQFKQKEDVKEEEDDELKEDEDEPKEEVGQNRMYQLNRKTLNQALLNHEIMSEIKENSLSERVKFGPMKVDGKHVTYKESRTNFFKEINKNRQSKLYQHNCYPGCKKRGCERVSTFDGLWKIAHPICMWECSSAYPKSITDFVPQVCTNEPKHGKAFCSSHSEAAEKLGRPSGLRPFLKSCGTDGENVKKEDKNKINNVLKDMAARINIKGKTVGEEQGTEMFLRNKEVMNKEKLTVVESGEEDCRKDVGENVRLRRFSRGILAACSGGGHIWSFDSLFKSEGPLQVSLLMLKYLMKRFPDTNPEEWMKHFVNYDNICNVDRLKLLQGLLPLPAPFSTIWMDVKKVIDPLHIKNHKNPECHTKYSPEAVKTEIPDANLMVAEQTFSWLGKFKKVLNSMPKYHQLFMLHRLVQRRNEYTQYCYSIGARPMLPSVKYNKTN